MRSYLIAISAALFVFILVSPIEVSFPYPGIVVYFLGSICLVLSVVYLLGWAYTFSENYFYQVFYYMVALTATWAAVALLCVIGLRYTMEATESYTLFKHKKYERVQIIVQCLNYGALGDGPCYTKRRISLLPGISWITEINTAKLDTENWIRVTQ
jgi:hypothetical protein